VRILRWILLPASLIYGLITEIRNFLFDKGLLRVYKIPVRSVVVGNLSTGGTGKTPHVAFLADLLKDKLKTVILSRGYGRKTKGFLWVDSNGLSNQFGDEPLFYARKFGVVVKAAVCEKRKIGIEQILSNKPETQLILLDDAFQHRAVKAGLNILLTDYSHPYYNDFMLPTGNLREFAVNKKRADLIIVSKCPDELTEERKAVICEQLNCGHKPVFFSKIVYGSPVSFDSKKWNDPKKVLLISGIANAQPLIEHLKKSHLMEHISFKDHHDFTATDIQAIQQKFDTFADDDGVILTTEKDFVRLVGKSEELKLEQYPWFYLPINIELDNFEGFKTIIDQYVATV
jgi:tetraacyldisaccharide 4'-kinase